MRKQIKIKQLVAILLPIVFILGIVYAIPNMISLRADDSSSQLTVQKGDEDITGKEISISDTSVKLKLTAKENHLYRLIGNDQCLISSANSDSRVLPSREVEVSTFDLNKELEEISTSSDKDEKNEIIYVNDSESGKRETYLKLLEGKTAHVIFSKENVGKEFDVQLENIQQKGKQKLFSFVLPKSKKNKEVSSEVIVDSNSSPKEETEKKIQPLAGNETLEELEKREFSEKESFKPIVLPLSNEEKQSVKAARAASSVNVTNAKLTLRTGTADFDTSGKNTNGYDDSEANNIVRSFDSNIYVLSFSLEGSDPGITYSDIKYRVDMELPNAYVKDSSGKHRFNGEVVSQEENDLVDEGDNKISKGHVEASIDSNGQILIPMFVNVYGAKNLTVIQPTIKITLISAKNDNTGNVEIMNKEYTDKEFKDITVPKTTVSARPSITAQLTLGGQKPFSNTITGAGYMLGVRRYFQTVGLGVTFELTPIPGRASDDFKGSTFPSGDITYNLVTGNDKFIDDAGIVTSVSQDPDENKTGNAYPVCAIAVNSGNLGTTVSDTVDGAWRWKKHKDPARTLNVSKEILARDIPYGRGKSLYTNEPDPDIDKSEIGVYHSGEAEISSAWPVTLKQSDYDPVWNPYTYKMDGTAMSKNHRSFASASILAEWSNLYFHSRGGVSKKFTSEVRIGNVSYDGYTSSGKNTVKLATSTTGSAVSQQILFSHDPSNGTNGLTIGSGASRAYALGDGVVPQGYKFWATARIDDRNASRLGKAVTYLRWNPNSAAYDPSREIFFQTESIPAEKLYGVKNSGTGAPSTGYFSDTSLNSQYTWYDTPEKASENGKLSCVKIIHDYIKVYDDGGWGTAFSIPVTAVGPAGKSLDASGNPNVVIGNSYFYDKNGNQYFSKPVQDRYYEPSKFNSNGVKTGGHYARDNYGNEDTVEDGDRGTYGDTFFIKGMGITTTTTPNKPVYQTKDKVEWKINGNIVGGNTNYTAKLITTIPKGLSYDAGSATDGQGNPLGNPTIKNNADGTTTLTWQISGINPSKGDIAEVNFSTTPILQDLTFDSESTAHLKATTVGELWVTNNPNDKDNSSEAFRSSSGEVELYQVQQISLEKKVSPDYIEVGNKDSNDPTLSNEITYTVTLKNSSSDKLTSVKVLDVLPFNGDSRNSKLSSTSDYKVTGAKMTKGTARIYYYNEDRITTDMKKKEFDPNNSPSAPIYTGSQNISDAEAFLIVKDTLSVGEEIEFEIKISPTGQQAGDIYRNQTTFNSHLNLPVKSNIVETTVYGRDLTGYVWYDDDYDGLIGKKADGTAEDPVANIPVRLYRIIDGNQELLKESLTGEQFVDASNNSKIVTKADGTYEFKNLPEGEYVAEFVVGDIVVTKKVAVVTKQLVGSDMSLNSKADPDEKKANPFRTPETKSDGTPFYKQPVLSDLPTLLTGTDKVHHITDVNAGLTRLSKIRLFKYEEGTAIDINNDKHLSEKEIEETATPLQYAEFDLFKGNSTDPADKIGSATTDEFGWLEFPGLAPGDYTIVETKAPPGFELLKNPIKVTVPTYNYIAIVHVADDGQTVLPFTGSTKAARIVLILSAVLLVIGMTGVFLHFRPIKAKGGR